MIVDHYEEYNQLKYTCISNLRLNVNECNVVEDECHVIMYGTLYSDICDQIYAEIPEISCQFPTLTVDDQFLQIMSNTQYYRAASRAMYNILNRRRSSMFQYLLSPYFIVIVILFVIIPLCILDFRLNYYILFFCHLPWSFLVLFSFLYCITYILFHYLVIILFVVFFPAILRIL